MSEQLEGAIVLTLVLAASGLGMVWAGRAAARRSIDWNWGVQNAGNTPPETWDEAHHVAGPIMERSGWLMTLSGVIGGPLLAWNEVAGLVTGGLLIAASLGMMFYSIVRGARVLGPAENLGSARKK